MASEDKQTYFCYFTILTKAQAISTLFLITMGMALSIRGIWKYRLIRKINLAKLVNKIFKLMFVWSLFYMGKLVFGELIFLLWPPLNDDTEKQELLSKISKIYFSIDVVAIMILQWILLLALNNWFIKIIRIVSLDEEQDGSEIKFEVNCSKFLNLYQYGRFLVLLLLIPIGILDNESKTALIWCIGIVLFGIIAQAFFIVIVLIFGIYSLKKNKRINSLIDPGDISLMHKQYLILLICSLFRFALDLTFMILNKWNFMKQVCFMGSVADQSKSLSLLILEAIFNHYVPILIVQRIYEIDKRDISLSKSLLNANSFPQQSSSELQI